jgi:autotransporter passenger strand-loop-strand repeat protein
MSTSSGYTHSVGSGQLVSNEVVSGGGQVVFGGTEAIILTSGGQQNISSGGGTYATTINSGCRQAVYYMGVASQTIVMDGGYIYIASGGHAYGVQQGSGATIDTNTNAHITGSNHYGSFRIAEGVASGFFLENGGYLRVEINDSASTTVIKDGTMVVSSGASATDTTLYSRGYQQVLPSATAVFTTIYSGGSQSLSSDSLAVDTFIHNGGVQSVHRGLASSTTIYSGGTQHIWTIGGSALDTIIDDGGYQYIGSACSADTTTISSGGSQHIYAGTVINTTINGGKQAISGGGSAINTTINGGEQEVYMFGMASHTIINSGGIQKSQANSMDITINSGGSQIIIKGSATDIIINNGGVQIISEPMGRGSVASRTIINSGGKQIVSGNANDTTISSGGSQVIVSGAYAFDIDLLSGGIIITNTDASVSGSNTRSDGHSAFGITFGTASNFLLENNSELTVYSGNSAYDTLVDNGGALLINSNGKTVDATINSGGLLVIDSMATMEGTNVHSGGILEVSSGGIVKVKTDETIFSGTNERTDGHDTFSLVGGIASNFLLENGGSMTVSSGHSAIDTVINSAGKQTILAGGTAERTTINSSGLQHLSSGGTARLTAVSSGGTQSINGYASASSTTINSSGLLQVRVGGTASIIDQQAGAIINTSTGATIASGINTRTDGFHEFSITSGHGSNFLLENGGHLAVCRFSIADSMTYYSTAFNTMINSGGLLSAGLGGVASASIINSGGSQKIINGGTASSSIINSGGFEIISSGGVASSSTILSGGSQTAVSSGSISDTTISSGGTLKLYNRAAIRNDLNINGGTLITNSSSYVDMRDGSCQVNLNGNADLSGALLIMYNGVDVNVQGTNNTVNHINFAMNGALNFDVSTLSASDTEVMLNDMTSITNADVRITIDSSSNSSGSYELAGNADTFNETISVYDDTTKLGNISLIDSLILGETGYSLSIENSELLFNINTIDIQPPSVPSVLTDSVDIDSAALGWADSTDNDSGIKEYLVEYSLVSDFSGAASQAVAVSELDLSSMNDGTWYWRVCAVDNDDNQSAWSATESFMIGFPDTQAPSTPTGLTTIVDGDDAYIDWADSTDDSGVNEYLVEFADNASFDFSELESTSSSDYELLEMGTGMWYWRIQAVDYAGNQSGWSTTDSFLIEQDVIAELQAGDAYTDYIGGTEVDSYKLVAVNPGPYIITTSAVSEDTLDSLLSLYDVFGNQIAYDDDGGDDYYSKIEVYLVPGTYYIDVKGYNSTATGEYQLSVDNMTTIPDTVAPGNPGRTSTVLTGNGSIDISWRAAKDNIGILEYSVDISQSQGMATVDTVYTGTPSNSYEWQGLASGTYYYQVTAWDGAGNSSQPTAVNSFFIPPDDNVGNTFAGATEIDVTTDYINNEYVGIGDACDMYCFDVDAAGEFDFALTELDSKTRLGIYKYDSVKDKYKRVKSANAKLNKMTMKASAILNNIMLDESTYYLEVLSGDKGKGKFNTDYTLDITPDYFPDMTDNNTWQQATDIVPDVNLNDFVGFGDARDYYKFQVNDLTAFDFDFAGDNKNAKLTVYGWNTKKGKLKKMKSVKLKYGEAHIDNLNLDAGLYYVEVLSSDKGRGKYNTEYDLDITAG